MKRWNDRIFRKHLGRIAVLFCLAVLLAGCSGSESAVPPPIPPPADTVTDDSPKQDSAPEPEPEPEPEPGPKPEPEIIGDALALVYEVWNLRSVSVQRQGKPGTLIVIQTHAENQTAHKAQLKHTLAELGSVTPSNAKDGMDANRLFAGEAEDALGAWVETDKNERIWRPIVAAVDAASVEIRPGEEKMVYWYVFLPEENGAWTQMHWGSREEQRGRFSPIPHKTA